MHTTSLLAVIFSIAALAQGARPEAREVMDMSPVPREVQNGAKAPPFDQNIHLKKGRRGVQGRKAPIFKGAPAKPSNKERDEPLVERDGDEKE